MPAQPLTSTTQLFLDIHDITNNLVIMKNGTTSIILTVDAMNFGLLAEEEQDGIIYAYAGLLNSLNYPIQIVVRSQTKDVTRYLTLLKEQEELATSSHIQNRIRTYREFVSNLIHERNVLDKKFYCVIPAAALELGLIAPSTGLPGSKPLDLHSVERSVIIEKAKSILEPKRDHLIAQFARIGLFARELETQEIIQLFYVSYNPEAAEGQEITDSSNYTTPLVKASTPQEFSVNEAVIQPQPTELQQPAQEALAPPPPELVHTELQTPPTPVVNPPQTPPEPTQGATVPSPLPQPPQVGGEFAVPNVLQQANTEAHLMEPIVEPSQAPGGAPEPPIQAQPVPTPANTTQQTVAPTPVTPQIQPPPQQSRPAQPEVPTQQARAVPQQPSPSTLPPLPEI